LIASDVGYIRLGTLGDLGALDSALDQFALKPPAAMVLDLRATPPSTDFEIAAEVCRRFAPKGRILFSIKRPKANDEEILTSHDDPRWRGLLVVLVDGDTAGSGEVIAAVLRTHLRAYIVGQQTKGEAAQFDDLPLGSGRVLRVAVGEVTLPDNSPVFPGGLRPDLAVNVPQQKTDELLLAALTDGVAPLVAEPERPRMNEAALVAGTNPELDAAQERRKPGALPPKPALRDETLQRALDYITGVRIYEAQRARGAR
jgi:C-terminal processing protease CtpA/Prc